MRLELLRHRWPRSLITAALLTAIVAGTATDYAVARAESTDYDLDDDGLIEIASLAQLDAVRLDLDGDGVVADSDEAAYNSVFPGALDDMGEHDMGCPGSVCDGYELVADLDFDSDGDGDSDENDHDGAFWNGGAGWDPIGESNVGLAARFHGNGHTISHLFINRPDTLGVGLFASSLPTKIRNVGLNDVNITGSHLTGSLVGVADDGTLSGVFATGDVSGNGAVGGIVGWSTADITASFARVSVTGTGNRIGGLAGYSQDDIMACYSWGSVAGMGQVGGLVGDHQAGTTTASYSAGDVSGSADVGGLTGYSNLRNDATVVDSYWDTQSSGVTTSSLGIGKTTSELRAPISYQTIDADGEAIFANWNIYLDLDDDGDGETDDPWDFGTTDQYPVLKLDFDGQDGASWEEFGSQRTGPDAPTITNVTPGSGTLAVDWSAPSIDGGSSITGYVVRYRRSAVSDGPTGPWTVVTETAPSTLQATISGLMPGDRYDIRVRGVNVIGDGVWAEIRSGIPANSDPAFESRDRPEFSVVENSAPPLTIGHPVAASDPNSDPLYYRLDGVGAANFSVSTVASGAQVEISPDADLNYEVASLYQLTLFVSDYKSADGSPDLADDDSVNLAVAVTDVNEAAVLPGEAFSVAENSFVVGGLDASDDDPIDSVVGYRLSEGSDSDRFELTAGGILTFVKAPNYEQPGSANGDNYYAIDVEISSGSSTRMLTSEQSVTIEVVDVNEPPFFTSLSTSTVAENTVYVGTIGADDEDAIDSVVGYRLSGGSDSDRFEVSADGLLAFVEAPNYEEPGSATGDNEYTIDIEITSGSSTRMLASEQSVTIEVVDVNEPPFFTSLSTSTVAENTVYVGTIGADDDDPIDSVVGYRLSGGSDSDRFEVSADGLLTFVEAPNYEEPGSATGDNEYTIDIEITSGSSTRMLPSERSVTIEVVDVNEPPFFTSPLTSTVAENTVHVGTIKAIDEDSIDSVVEFRLAGGHDSDRFELSADGVLRFMEAPNFEEPGSANGDNHYAIDVEITSGSSTRMLTSEQSVAIEVVDVNEPPFFTSPSTSTVAENTVDVGTIEAMDEDSIDSVARVRIIGGPDSLSFSMGPDGELSFTAPPDFELPGSAAGTNTYSVDLEATGGSGDRATTTTQTVTVTVQDTNEPPIPPTVSDQSVVEGHPFSYTVEPGLDPEGSPMTYDFSVEPEVEWISFATSTRTFLATTTTAGIYYVTLAVMDVHSETATTTFSLTVAAQGAPVFLSPPSFSVRENTVYVGRIEASDPDIEDRMDGYEISGGADREFFELTVETVDKDIAVGILSFRVAPDFENATDRVSTVPSNGQGNNEYLIRVTATSGEDGRATTMDQVIMVTVTDVRPPPAMEAPVVRPAVPDGHTALEVTWTAPEALTGHASSTGYIVQYRKADASLFSPIGSTDSRTRTLRITGLDPETSYKARVLSTSIEGDSEWSVAGSGQTAADPNSAPDDPGTQPTQPRAQTGESEESQAPVPVATVKEVEAKRVITLDDEIVVVIEPNRSVVVESADGTISLKLSSFARDNVFQVRLSSAESRCTEGEFPPGLLLSCGAIEVFDLVGSPLSGLQLSRAAEVSLLIPSSAVEMVGGISALNQGDVLGALQLYTRNTVWDEWRPLRFELAIESGEAVVARATVRTLGTFAVTIDMSEPSPPLAQMPLESIPTATAPTTGPLVQEPVSTTPPDTGPSHLGQNVLIALMVASTLLVLLGCGLLLPRRAPPQYLVTISKPELVPATVPDQSAGQLQHSQEVSRLLFISHEETTTFREPPESPFDDPSSCRIPFVTL